MSTAKQETATQATVQRRTAEPWSLLELNRIVMSARTMPEPVGEIPGKHFWPALILLLLDLDISAEISVQLPASALDMATGRIGVNHLLYQLHGLTLEALNVIIWAIPQWKSHVDIWTVGRFKKLPPQILWIAPVLDLQKGGNRQPRKNDYPSLVPRIQPWSPPP